MKQHKSAPTQIFKNIVTVPVVHVTFDGGYNKLIAPEGRF